MDNWLFCEDVPTRVGTIAYWLARGELEFMLLARSTLLIVPFVIALELWLTTWLDTVDNLLPTLTYFIGCTVVFLTLTLFRVENRFLRILRLLHRQSLIILICMYGMLIWRPWEALQRYEARQPLTVDFFAPTGAIDLDVTSTFSEEAAFWHIRLPYTIYRPAEGYGQPHHAFENQLARMRRVAILVLLLANDLLCQCVPLRIFT